MAHLSTETAAPSKPTMQWVLMQFEGELFCTFALINYYYYGSVVKFFFKRSYGIGQVLKLLYKNNVPKHFEFYSSLFEY